MYLSFFATGGLGRPFFMRCQESLDIPSFGQSNQDNLGQIIWDAAAVLRMIRKDEYDAAVNLPYEVVVNYSRVNHVNPCSLVDLATPQF